MKRPLRPAMPLMLLLVLLLLTRERVRERENENEADVSSVHWLSGFDVCRRLCCRHTQVSKDAASKPARRATSASCLRVLRTCANEHHHCHRHRRHRLHPRRRIGLMLVHRPPMVSSHDPVRGERGLRRGFGDVDAVNLTFPIFAEWVRSRRFLTHLLIGYLQWGQYPAKLRPWNKGKWMKFRMHSKGVYLRASYLWTVK